MHLLSSRWNLIFLRIASAGPQVAESIHEHWRNAHPRKGVWLCKHLYFYCLLSTWSPFQVWTTQIPIIISWYLCGLEWLHDILEEYNLESQTQLFPKAMSNDELGAEFLYQENSIYRKFKSIATSTAGNCTLYSLNLKALLVPLQPLKEIIPH